MPPKENRMMETDDIEMRAEAGSENRFVEGIGIIYERETEIFPGFWEKIRPGAFAKTLEAHAEIKSFFNHNADQVLATTRSKPALVLEDSDKNLRFKAPIPPTTYGNDLKVNLERKNVRGASFSFTVEDEGQIITRDEKGVLHREVTKAIIWEVGPVTNPAYTQTTAHLRSAEETYQQCLKDYEKTKSVAEGESRRIEINKNELELRKRQLSLT